MVVYDVVERQAWVGDSGEDGRIEVPDGAVLFNTELRGSNRVVAIIGLPVEHICGAPLKGEDGRCSRTVENPDERCYQHA